MEFHFFRKVKRKVRKDRHSAFVGTHVHFVVAAAAAAEPACCLYSFEKSEYSFVAACSFEAVKLAVAPYCSLMALSSCF